MPDHWRLGRGGVDPGPVAPACQNARAFHPVERLLAHGEVLSHLSCGNP